MFLLKPADRKLNHLNLKKTKQTTNKKQSLYVLHEKG